MVLFWLDHGWVGEAYPEAAARGDGAAVPLHGCARVRRDRLRRVLGRAQLRPRAPRRCAAARDRAPRLRGVRRDMVKKKMGTCARSCVLTTRSPLVGMGRLLRNEALRGHRSIPP